jgi:large subunit ribosomal protein L46
LAVILRLDLTHFLFILALLPEGYTPAPIVTEADKTGELQTHNRKLQERLYLTIPSADDPSKWIFPTVLVKDEETLLAAAKRAVKQVGPTMDIWCPSNCPWAVDLSVHNKPEGFFGTKTFFLKVQHDEGDADISKQFAWLSRTEMAERVREQEGVKASKFYHYML